MIEHRVYFKLKPEATDAQFQEIYAHITGLKASVYGILSADFMKNISREGKDLGCKDMFIMRFKTARSLQEYLVNPEHIRVAQKHFRPYVDAVLVFDTRI